MTLTLVFTPVILGPHNSAYPLDGTLRCSVHVGVFASQATTVAALPALAAWPTAMPGFSVALANGTTLPATVTSAPTAAAWAAYFPPALTVRAWRPPAPLPAAADDRWFDAGAVASQAQAHYATAAQTPLAPAPVALPHPLPHPLQPVGLERAGRVAIGAGPDPAALALLAAKAYFQPPATKLPAPPTPPPPDLHELIAYLHQTPAVLRALGLIIDIQAPWPGGAPPATTSISVTPHFPSGATPPDTVSTPWVSFSTAACQRANGFEPAAGLQLLAYDPMHAAHVFSRYGGGALPALRSSGLSLMRLPTGGASANMALVRSRMSRWAALAASPPTADAPLAPADLTAGHRIDVWDGTAWRSLCQVTGTATRGGLSLPIDAEGIVAGNVVTDPDGVVRANDTLAYWTGWSLCAPRPTINTNPLPPSAAPPAGVAIARSPAPGSLPTLRFGKSYRLRARVVDVTGHSLLPPGPVRQAAGPPAWPVELQDEFLQATEPQTFLRCEPVGSPAMVFAAPPGPGESSTQLVVGTSPQPSRRYLLPPEASVHLAERHGVFDLPDGAPNPAAYGAIQQKLQGGGSLWNAAETRPSTAFPLKADVLNAQVYAGAAPAIPYLPDPACGGATVIALTNGAAIGLANGAAVSLSFAAAGTYPDSRQAGTLTLVPGATGTPGSIVAAGAQGLEITLPPGERVTVGLASTIPAAVVPVMALAQWAHAGLTGAAQATYMQSVQAGLVGATTPYREVALIHAVQQPLAAPTITGAGVNWPTPGDLAATIVGAISVDAKTTATVTVEASWTDWIDGGPGTPPPVSRAVTAHVATLTVDPVAGAPALASRYVFGDTKCRNPLTLNAIAASAFAEFFPGADCTLRSATPAVTFRGATQQPATPRLAYVTPAFKWTRSAPLATAPYVSTRLGNALRVYLERPWRTSGNGEVLAVIVGTGPLNSATQPSVWGADPLAALEPPATANICDFLSATESNFAGAVTFTLQDTGETVTLKLYQVEYDAVTDRYFCDVTFNAAAFGGAYRPFVQLQIGAYQPNAGSPAYALSGTVTTPFTQVFPDRTLTVTLSSSAASPSPAVRAVLQGVGPQASSTGYTSGRGRGIATQIDAHYVFSGVVTQKQLPPLPAGSKPPTTTGPDGKPLMAGRQTLPNGDSVWVPDPPSAGPQPAYPPVVEIATRLVLNDGGADSGGTLMLGEGAQWETVEVTIYEWEMLSPSPQMLDPVGPTPPSGAEGYVLTDFGARPWRLVYTETVSIPSGWTPPAPTTPQPIPGH